MGCRELQINDYFRMTDSACDMDVPYYALADANKNITEYFDTNGNVVAHYEYSPFGKITQSSGTMASDFDYRFSSEVFDNETGLSYYNYRYYSAELGRWLSRDPIGEKGGYNLYAMVGNNLIGFIDLLGNCKGSSKHYNYFAAFAGTSFGWFTSKKLHSVLFSYDWDAECDSKGKLSLSNGVAKALDSTNLKSTEADIIIGGDSVFVSGFLVSENPMLVKKMVFVSARSTVLLTAAALGLISGGYSVVITAGSTFILYFINDVSSSQHTAKFKIKCVCDESDGTWKPEQEQVFEYRGPGFSGGMFE